MSAKENASSQASLNYDAHNNLSSFTDERNANDTYSYNTGTNKHQLKTAESSSSGVKYNYSYNTNGTLKAQEITNASEAATIRTGIQYTSASGGIAAGAYVLSENDQHGHSTTYDYNLTTGRLNSVTDPMGNTTSYSYNANNGLMQSVSNGAQTVSYTYNTQNTRLNSISRNGMTYNFVYDGFGNVTSTKVGTTTLVTNTYQPNNGNLLSSTYGNNLTVCQQKDP